MRWIIVAAVWVVYPVVAVLLRQRVPLRQAYVPFDPAQLAVPRLTVRRMQEQSEVLRGAGYACRGWITHTRSPKRSLVAAVHEGPGGEAVVVLLAPVSGAWAQPVLANCLTQLEDGGVLTTTNAPQAMPMPPLPGDEAWQLPQVHDAARLARLHAAAVARSGRTVRPRAVGDDPAAFFAARVDAQNERQRAAGTLRRAAGADHYRYRPAGAVRMVLAAWPPFGSIARAAVRMRGGRLLAVLEPPSR